MAETVNSGSVEPDQASTCEGNKSRYLTRILLEIYLQITTVFLTVIPLVASNPSSIFIPINNG
ncbi:hypothetical protein EDB73_12533 [Vibrio crassostreae]|nr:hypothetical protein EDB56_11733 [Vibrio crassostreae]ROO48965.1 hypothetical protein EDB58_1215 [Vibrio crassostreae]ROP10875.1 hypothetical protein EDB33_12433 [Vibrio crassostreae]ROP14902.1 hypothetical protein EDB34_12433 [Vibrio crassostreae]ROS58555.1 hypothetical protein EDB73_12533 [Vibrio crassostreae]